MFCDKELDEHVKIWKGTSYDETMIDDIFEFGYKKGRTETLKNLRESLEKRKKELEECPVLNYYDIASRIRMIESIINEFLREK